MNYSITREQCRQLEEEERIAKIVMALYEAGNRVGYKMTIEEAIAELNKMTRFKNDVEDFVNRQFYPLTSQLSK